MEYSCNFGCSGFLPLRSGAECEGAILPRDALEPLNLAQFSAVANATFREADCLGTWVIGSVMLDLAFYLHFFEVT